MALFKDENINFSALLYAELLDQSPAFSVEKNRPEWSNSKGAKTYDNFVSVLNGAFDSLLCSIVRPHKGYGFCTTRRISAFRRFLLWWVNLSGEWGERGCLCVNLNLSDTPPSVVNIPAMKSVSVACSQRLVNTAFYHHCSPYVCLLCDW